ncbi:hypothetical protein K440DRAFT_632060 [Wilcoxina mikolae CBS 423.85]|nr:hypothetical protein K440DRAFT_632060 [Wilcoxina mikolae CBS 423.85]
MLTLRRRRDNQLHRSGFVWLFGYLAVLLFCCLRLQGKTNTHAAARSTEAGEINR